ncbi:hypothetical protein MSG28_011805 [Choristoneura fumiferana]|uniref:Uncharacterized protein n=1 Tax=Choristoneura fumiferana TaxID=7141 RepID=A0ACC0KLN1_CHOFU|nr:hypothetical protein MSG28_011805 [Choristoneura fumiferana]
MVIPVDGAAEDSPEVTTYNEVQKRARSSIDQTFGILKARRAKTTQKLLSSVDTVTVSIKIRKKMEGGCRRAALLATIDTLSELWARALEVSAGRAAAALRARDGAGRVLGSRAEPLTGKALPKSDAAPAAPAGPATAAADALQRAREDRDRLIRDLKQGLANDRMY